MPGSYSCLAKGVTNIMWTSLYGSQIDHENRSCVSMFINQQFGIIGKVPYRNVLSALDHLFEVGMTIYFCSKKLIYMIEDKNFVFLDWISCK